MYSGTKTWNCFVGCEFDCTYCVPTFKAQAKRQKQNCLDCYHYRPHYHPERLKKIPYASTVFAGGYSDVSFCEPDYMRQIIGAVKKNIEKLKRMEKPHSLYYFQSKRPEYFDQFLDELPSPFSILVTTLETNRDRGYDSISKAPLPSERYRQFKALDYPYKVVTVEPIMDFDLEEFLEMLVRLKPLYVWIGFNSRPKQVQLPEPHRNSVNELIHCLKLRGIDVREKDLRK